MLTLGLMLFVIILINVVRQHFPTLWLLIFRPAGPTSSQSERALGFRTAKKSLSSLRRLSSSPQVREMEEIIRRRYPNSLPALIYAAASAPGHAQLVKDESPKKDSASQAFLENRIRKLEAALENKEEESGRRIRAVEQQYSAVRVAHDERVRQLEAELKVRQQQQQ